MTVHALRTNLLWAALMVPLLACGNAGGDGDFDFSTDSNGPAPTSGTAGTAGSADTGSSSDPTQGVTGGSGQDTMVQEDSTTGDELPPPVPCTAVDILFVVDNSEPMIEEQIRLRANVLAFIQQIQTNIPTLMSDVHVGVITTDESLFVQPSGDTCVAFEGGANWMLSSSLALQAELDCALSVGTLGSPNERPMDMLVEALSDDNLAPGGFHNGFLRDDALLIVVVVTNEEDAIERDTAWGSAGGPAEWADAVAVRKGGYPSNVVALSLLGLDKPNACLGPWDGTVGAEFSPRLIEFTESFPIAAAGDICAQEYASFLLGAVPGIAAACAGYIPP